MREMGKKYGLKYEYELEDSGKNEVVLSEHERLSHVADKMCEHMQKSRPPYQKKHPFSITVLRGGVKVVVIEGDPYDIWADVLFIFRMMKTEDEVGEGVVDGYLGLLNDMIKEMREPGWVSVVKQEPCAEA